MDIFNAISFIFYLWIKSYPQA